MADEAKVEKAEAKRWDTTGYRVLPVEARGGDRFFLLVPKGEADLDACLARVAGKPAGRQPEFNRVGAGEIATTIPAIEVPGLLRKGVIVKANGPDDPYRDKTPPKAPPPPKPKPDAFEEVEP